MTSQLVVFKENLEEFAKKYRKEINKNPEFRKYFQGKAKNIIITSEINLINRYQKCVVRLELIHLPPTKVSGLKCWELEISFMN